MISVRGIRESRRGLEPFGRRERAASAKPACQGAASCRSNRSRLAPRPAGDCQHDLHSYKVCVIGGSARKARNTKIKTQFRAALACVHLSCMHGALRNFPRELAEAKVPAVATWTTGQGISLCCQCSSRSIEKFNVAGCNSRLIATKNSVKRLAE
jgi:hypothetical protein